MQTFPMGFDRDNSAGYVANHMARLFARHIERGIRPLGLSIGAFPALLHLWERDGLTQKELVERIGIEQPTLAATLARMERDGLVTRHRDDRDGRIQRIRLTAQSRKLRDEAVAEALAVNEKALGGLSDAERRQFLDLMQRVIAGLETSK